MTDELRYEKEGAIATLTLNRPDRLNAITGPDARGALRRARRRGRRSRGARRRDHRRRQGLLRGARPEGRGRGAGDRRRRRGRRERRRVRPAHAPPIVLHNMDKPTICALNGAAAGYGMDLALGCDIRIAADTAKLAAGLREARRPARRAAARGSCRGSSAGRRPRRSRSPGRTLDADECLALGLVNKVVPAELLAKEARALAEEIAANAPLAVQATKRMMRMGARRDVRRERAPRLPAAPPALPQPRLPGGREVLHRAPPAEVRARALSEAGPGAQPAREPRADELRARAPSSGRRRRRTPRSPRGPRGAPPDATQRGIARRSPSRSAAASSASALARAELDEERRERARRARRRPRGSPRRGGGGSGAGTPARSRARAGSRRA